MKIQLFNGKDLDNWTPRGEHSQHQWDVVGHIDLDAQNPKQFTTKKGEGIFYNGPTGRTADLYTKYQHGDCELHIEFVVPQGSNSGIYFMTKYEIQILDSWGETDLTFGTCGGVYARWINEQSIGGTPPRINMSKPPGEWQTYDIVFKAPRFNHAGNKTDNAKFVKVIWNGKIVHENVEIKGPTRAAIPSKETTKAPLMLQGDHGPVAYRNVILQPLDDK